MKSKKALNINEVIRFQGELSRELADRCPDRLVVFPSAPCSNIGCEHAIQQPGYMNCSFVAAEAGEHTLEAIGEMMGITREGVRLIEVRAMKKFRARLAEQEQPENGKTTTPHKPCMATGGGNLHPLGHVAKLTDPSDFLPAINGRKLGECSG